MAEKNTSNTSSITIQQYAQSLHEAISDSNPKDHDKVIDNLIKILKTNNDLGKYEKIVDAYEKILEQEGNKTEIEVTTTSQTEVSPTLLKELNHFAHENKSTKVTTTKDDSIIGGVLIKVDDTLIDASLKNQLDNLHSHLQK